MPDVEPFSAPSWFVGEAAQPASTPAAGPAAGPRKRIPRHQYDDHPLVLAVRQFNIWLDRNGETAISPRSLDEYVGILCAGIEAGDLCTPLRASRTSSRFHAVRAALRFAARAVEAKRPLLVAHGIVDSQAVYGIDVERLVERTDRRGPKAVRPAKLALSEGEWSDFARVIRQRLAPPMRDVCLVLVQGDLRANDVLRITRPVAESITQRGQAVTVQKGGRQRVWIAEPEVRQALSRLLRDSSWNLLRDLVVRPGELGDADDVRLIRAAYGRIYRALDGLAEAEKLPGFHGTHAFRRALAAKMVRQRAPDRVIQSTLGHANLSTTQIYTGGASPDEVEEYRSKVRQEVFGKKGERS